jgi:fructose-1,6-bisphosphatase/inositol monophosphatase family enzyme
MTYKKELMVAKDIARQAGVIMMKYFDEDQHVEEKSDNSPVTIADKKINSLVINELGKHFDDVIIGEEESTGEYGAGRRWFCDPIDGTRAFVLGVPAAMFSLALTEDGRSMLGVVYDPFLDRMYEAVRGGGSYCNGRQLRVSSKTIEHGVVGVTDKVTQQGQRRPYIDRLLDKKIKLMSLNSSVYKACLVACGKIDGSLEYRANAYDVAAVDIIVGESGGVITGLNGKILDYRKPFKGAIISNGVIHDELVTSMIDAVSK